jgi:hypothetical protein
METAEILQCLLELADEIQLEVRILRGQNGPDPEFIPTSACCRVKGKVWVVLSPNDPADLHIRVLASGLKSEAGTALESRYLPPAVRQALDGQSDPDR